VAVRDDRHGDRAASSSDLVVVEPSGHVHADTERAGTTDEGLEIGGVPVGGTAENRHPSRTGGRRGQSCLVVALHVPPGENGMRVGAARNAAARLALEHDVDLLIFLDVDCLPGSGLLERYVEAARAHPDDLLCGPVTYLESVQRPSTLDDLEAATRPHPVRPHPAQGTVVPATDDQFDLFWSLSFAVTPATWTRLGGFDEVYEGYGAEDTDLGRRARSLGVGLQWVGGAHAYHQWHPAGTPPWRHLDDILRNGALFAERWGEWPMGGWIDAFVDAGAVEAVDSGYRRVRR